MWICAGECFKLVLFEKCMTDSARLWKRAWDDMLFFERSCYFSKFFTSPIIQSSLYSPSKDLWSSGNDTRRHAAFVHWFVNNFRKKIYLHYFIFNVIIIIYVYRRGSMRQHPFQVEKFGRMFLMRVVQLVTIFSRNTLY